MSELKPYCFSNICNKNVYKYTTKGVEKIVPKGSMFCPDCKHALRWIKPKEKDKKNLHLEPKIKKNNCYPMFDV